MYLALPDGPDGYPPGPGWLCRMVRGGFAGWAGVDLPDGPDWFCWMGQVVFARWAGWSLPDGPDWLGWMDRVDLPNVIVECGMGTWEGVATWDQ